MGRYYSGDISGKFWFAVQNSDDADNFCEDSDEIRKDIYRFKVCGCLNQDEDDFCSDCYQSFREHYDACVKDYPDVEHNSLECDEYSEIEYNFNQEHLEYVRKVLIDIERELGQNIMDDMKLHIGNQDDGYEYECDDDDISDDNVNENTYELIARYCFGKQIEKCLTETGCCSFGCEL